MRCLWASGTVIVTPPPPRHMWWKVRQRLSFKVKNGTRSRYSFAYLTFPETPEEAKVREKTVLIFRERHSSFSNLSDVSDLYSLFLNTGIYCDF